MKNIRQIALTSYYPYGKNKDKIIAKRIFDVDEAIAKHDSDLLDKVAEKFISWDSKVKGTREDGVCFFTIENILKGIEEMKAEVTENDT